MTIYDIWFLLIVGLILTGMIFKWIKSLRVFHFENIGSTFSIKYYHPLNRGIIFLYLEFPISNITRFKIKQRFWKTDLIKIDILITERNKIVRFRLKVSNLDDDSFHKIEHSLKSLTN